jgi:hypothetical protein
VLASAAAAPALASCRLRGETRTGVDFEVAPQDVDRDDGEATSTRRPEVREESA